MGSARSHARSNIVPFIKEHGTNPVTGRQLAIKELTTLHFHKNPSGEYHCPLTFKVFNDHSHIVAIRTSGNVYVRRWWEKSLKKIWVGKIS